MPVEQYEQGVEDGRKEAEAELARLREELDGRPKVYFPLEDSDKVLRQRDTLLAALKRIEAWCDNSDDHDTRWPDCPSLIARAAIAKVEEQP